MNYVTLPTYPQICIAPQTFCIFTSRYYNAKNTTRIICSVSQTYFLADQVIVWFVTADHLLPGMGQVQKTKWRERISALLIRLLLGE